MQQNGWVIFEQSECTILPPNVISLIKIEDLTKMDAVIWPEDALAMDELAACYLKGETLQEALANDPKWSKINPDDEYMYFISAALIAGDISFYSEDPFRTPLSLQINVGERCKNAPNKDAIKKDHDILIENFDAYTRAFGAATSCDEYDFDIRERVKAEQEIFGPQSLNASISFEYRLITMGAGWYGDAMNPFETELRPPLCHFKD